MPLLAMAASWMEAAKMPLRQVRRSYTKSEMSIMAWRSAEIAYNMTDRMQTIHERQSVVERIGANKAVQNAVADNELQLIEERMGPVAFKIANDDGEIDLRKLTGQEAAAFFGAFGIPVPIPE